VELPPFDRVVTEHGPVVLRVCRALVGAVDADDAWSETFLSALRAYPDLRPDSDVRAWLVTIAHHRSIDLLRRRARGALPSEDLDELAVSDPDGGALEEPLRTAVQSLPPKQRAAVAYRYLADLSYAQIGELLGTNEAAARRSAADGIAALRAGRTDSDRMEGAPR
jgi:RNA polymerase sigma factor (sigma-70 family)